MAKQPAEIYRYFAILYLQIPVHTVATRALSSGVQADNNKSNNERHVQMGEGQNEHKRTDSGKGDAVEKRYYFKK